MRSDSEPVDQNDGGANAERAADTETQHRDSIVPSTWDGSSSPPSETHCKCTYQPEKDWWDKFKKYAEIVGLLALIVYTVYTIKMYCANRDAANAAKSSAETAHGALVLANRPWIKINHRIVSPLNFNFVGAAGAAAIMTVEDRIENVGNGVALDVLSWEDIIPLEPDLSAITALKRRDQWCNANRTFNPNSPMEVNGYTLFPKDPLIRQSRMGPLMSTVSVAAKAFMMNGDLYKGKGPNPLAGKVAFAMVGCVVYRSSFDKDGTRPDMTAFMYRLGESEQGGMMFPFVTPKGIANKLQLFSFGEASFAD